MRCEKRQFHPPTMPFVRKVSFLIKNLIRVTFKDLLPFSDPGLALLVRVHEAFLPQVSMRAYLGDVK